MPGIQGFQFGFLLKRQLILESIHFTYPEHFPVEQQFSN
jgi:hypothetical protein